MSKNHTGVLGIDYQEVSKVENNSDTDWMCTCIIKEDSDGLTKTGQKLFPLAVESYVYAVLGAQAQTRWSIVSHEAKSLQTQEIFHRLVKDTITQDDPVKAISDMRLSSNVSYGTVYSLIIFEQLKQSPCDIPLC